MAQQTVTKVTSSVDVQLAIATAVLIGVSALAFLIIPAMQTTESNEQQSGICTDSDGGILFTTPGVVTADGVENSDDCESNGFFEYFCDNNKAVYTAYKCGEPIYDGGSQPSCSNDACVPLSVPDHPCTDSDNGINIYQKGSLSVEGQAANTVFGGEDSCINISPHPQLVTKGSQLKEYFCGKSQSTYLMDYTIYSCPFGCVDGACLTEPQTNTKCPGFVGDIYNDHVINPYDKYSQSDIEHLARLINGYDDEGIIKACADLDNDGAIGPGDLSILKNIVATYKKDNECTDADDGIDPNANVDVTYKGKIYHDTCIDNYKIEYFCENNKVSDIKFKCANSCLRDSCSLDDGGNSGISIEDTDFGYDFYHQGLLVKDESGLGSNTILGVDTCLIKNNDAYTESTEGAYLREMISGRDSSLLGVISTVYQCPNGCKNGACIGCSGMLGDLTRNNYIDLADQTILASIIAGNSNFDACGDMDKNGIINTTDLNLFRELSSLNKPDCIDSDGGVTYDKRGTTSGIHLATSSTTATSKNDTCTGSVLTEWSCANNYMESSQYTCPYGCKGGICLPAIGTTRYFYCAGPIPENTRWNEVSEYGQTWNGTAWLPANSTTSYNTTSSTTSCRYTCIEPYTMDGDSCELKVGAYRTFQCNSSKPYYSDWNTVSKYGQTWNGTEWTPPDSYTSYNTESSTTACRFKCQDGFTWKNYSCVSNTTRLFSCSPKPTNTEWNLVSSYSQSFINNTWTPPASTTTYNIVGSFTACRFKCIAGYTWNGTACIK
ncbi:MAG: hypothetical protein NTZ49_02080 [Candidatus Parcubacteria bacterium]|nr:hypothetical protein [Candidatus Parcubacteria bacterium]